MDDAEGINGNLSSDAALQRKRKRRKAHRLGDDSLASIGKDDSGPALKKSRDVRGSSYALSQYLSASPSAATITLASKSSRSDSSLDTLQVRTNRRNKGASSELCKMAGKATGTGIRARTGARSGVRIGTGTETGTVKERSARPKALVSVTQKDNDHDIR